MQLDENADIYTIINKMRTVQAMNDTSIAQSHVTKKIDSDSIFLVGYGDLHIENLGTDLERVERELKVMASIPNLYVVFMGDLTDSSVKYLNNNFDTYLTPKAAREFGYRIFDALGKKLICALSGCHEKHSEEVADFDYVEDYCKNNHIPFLNERGLLTLEMADGRVLNIAVAHKAQGYSMYNPFHPAIRMIRETYPDADVVITAHQHQSGISIQNEQGKARAMMVVGSRKQGDRYATRRGFEPQSPNKNLPVLEIVRGGYKILNDITLLENDGGSHIEATRKIGNSLLKHAEKEINKSERKTQPMPFSKSSDDVDKHVAIRKTKVSKAKSYETVMNEKIEENILNENKEVTKAQWANNEESQEEARLARNRETKRKYREAHRDEYNKYSREWKRAKAANSNQ